MKKALLIIVIFICSAQLYSAEPLVRFYLQDGSTKQYNLREIDNMKFPNAPDTLQLQIFTKDGKTFYYPAQLIDSIKFAVDNSNENRLHLWHDSFDWDVAIHEIDSVLLYYTTYTAVTIGTQNWMLKNLDVDHYRNGDSIPEVKDLWEWASLSTDAWCYYNNDPVNGLTYGKLYNWFAVNDPRGLVPKGWHVPTDAEWKELEMCLGMTQAEADTFGWRGTDQGGKLKSTGTKEAGDGLWYSPNTGATNESGFSALPGGFRYYDGTFGIIGYDGYWWTSTELSTSAAWTRGLRRSYAIIYRDGAGDWGFSVRCIKNK